MFDVFEAQVLANQNGDYGDRHGVIIDEERALANGRRSEIAVELQYAETVFINDIDNSDVSFFSQRGKIPFAGTAALAATAMLHKLTGRAPMFLVSDGHHIPVNIEDDATWVEADLSIMPPWNHKELASTVEVESITSDASLQFEHTVVWALIDRTKGFVLARTFASDWKLPEVEANGSGSMMLAAILKRSLIITHGKGSRILVEPRSANRARLGGYVKIGSASIKKLSGA